jgi:CheY-like chemotaxis protein
MDGFEVARWVRQQPGLENVMLAVSTGWGQKDHRRRTDTAGFNHQLIKLSEPKSLEVSLAELKDSAK